MIDVEKDGVEGAAGDVRIEAVAGRESEEVALDESTAGIGAELGAEGNESVAVPRNDLRQGLHHVEGAHAFIPEGGAGGVAEAQASDDDIELVSADSCEAVVGESDLDGREQARHEVAGSEDDFVDLEIVE